MSARLLDRAAPAPVVRPSSRPASVPEPAYDARPRLTELRDALAAMVSARTPGRWKEPPLFFFDHQRQAELEAARPPSSAEPFAEVSNRIAAELPALCASVEVRRVARAIDGLHAATGALSPVCPTARDLADLLVVPDDEVFLVLHPERRAGFRLVARGVVDVGQFHILMANALVGGQPMPERFVAACRDVNPATPAGVPMVAEARFQMYTPAALRPDGTLPAGFGGCEYWLWPAMALATVPRIGGERVMLLGPPAYSATWDVTRRFPAMPAELRVIETLSPLRVAERLASLTGQPFAATPQREPALSSAA